MAVRGSFLVRIVPLFSCLGLLVLWLAGCTPLPAALAVDIGRERFQLELALTPAARGSGLMGRASISDYGGMLFAYPSPRPVQYGMPHCQVPIDLLFIDAAGRVIGVHAMAVEPPQAPGESDRAYGARLPRYASVQPTQFVIELRGGRVAELGIGVGVVIALPLKALAGWAE